MKKVITKIAKIALQILYIPFFVAFYLLHETSRILLAISYMGLGSPRAAKDILTSIFSRYGRNKRY